MDKQKYIKTNVKITSNIKSYIYKYVIKRIVFNYKNLLLLIKKKFNITISKSSIYNILHNLHITRKKINKRRIYGSYSCIQQKIIDFKKTTRSINKNNIISIDEVSFNTNIYSDYGWQKRGTKIHLFLAKRDDQ